MCSLSWDWHSLSGTTSPFFVHQRSCHALLSISPRLDTFHPRLWAPGHIDRVSVTTSTEYSSALIKFVLWVVREYVEDFLARIDAPQLYCILIFLVLLKSPNLAVYQALRRSHPALLRTFSPLPCQFRCSCDHHIHVFALSQTLNRISAVFSVIDSK